VSVLFDPPAPPAPPVTRVGPIPVKIVVALPGLTTGYGPSHQAAEDLALMPMEGGARVVTWRHRASGMWVFDFMFPV